jgi:flagellar hook-basal body complex protein FliE
MGKNESPIKELTLETVPLLAHGQVMIRFGKLLKQAIDDCIDRPGDDRARKLTLQLDIKPIKEVTDNVISCEGAGITVQLRLKIPDFQTKVLDIGVKQTGHAWFNADSPDNSRQTTLGFGDDSDAD